MRQFNPELYDFNDTPTLIFDKEQNPIPNTKVNKIKKELEKILQDANQTANSQHLDMSLLESIHISLKENDHTINLEDLNWELKYLSLFTGTEVEFLSAKNWNQMGDLGGDHLLLSSYEPLIKHLSNNQNILLNTIIKSIEYSKDNVKIISSNEEYIVDAVIVTVPLGVLQQNTITFSPRLPQNKEQAIHRLKMSKLNKVGMLFPKQFWPNDVVIIGFENNSNDYIPLFFNYSYFFPNHFILLGAISGEAAQALENMDNNAFVENAMRTLRKLFGKDIPEPIKIVETNWLNDIYSMGSYSYIPVHASGDDFDTLAEPIDNKIFFAGEATYKICHSTVQGAYLSGIREANRIIHLNEI